MVDFSKSEMENQKFRRRKYSPQKFRRPTLFLIPQIRSCFDTQSEIFQTKNQKVALEHA